MRNNNFELEPPVLQCGSSLLELMLAMLLTSMLVLALSEASLTALQGWRQVQMLVDINQRGRIALLIIRRQLEDCLTQSCRVRGYSSKQRKREPIKRFQGDVLELIKPHKKPMTLRFYVARNRRRDSYGQNLSGLYLKRGNKRATELVEGITAIHCRYWQATPTPGFYPAAAISNWSKVKLVEVTVTLYPYITTGMLPHEQLLNWSMDVAIN